MRDEAGSDLYCNIHEVLWGGNSTFLNMKTKKSLQQPIAFSCIGEAPPSRQAKGQQRALCRIGSTKMNRMELTVLSFFIFFCRWFDKFQEIDFARAGTKATFSVALDAGPLEQFTHSMEPQLRQLGLPTALKKGECTI